jgi:quercetin dioxygenase-like cupin family protein
MSPAARRYNAEVRRGYTEDVILKNVSATAAFSPARMGKSTLVQGRHLFAGLNSFEPGQEHAPHTHADQDKFYFVVEGSGLVQVGAETATLTAGDAAFAAAGVEHSVRNPGPDRLIVMVALSPPPPRA